LNIVQYDSQLPINRQQGNVPKCPQGVGFWAVSLILIQVKQSGVLVNLFHTFFTLIKRLQLNC